MLIEGTGFALAAAAYLYLLTQSPAWPPEGTRCLA
jgi:cytochrome c oxidase subunit 3